MNVFILTHHNGLYGRGAVGVYSERRHAKAGALTHTRRLRAEIGARSGNEYLTWESGRDGDVWFASVADGRGGSYEIAEMEVVTSRPEIVGVREAEIDHFASLVTEGLQDLDAFGDEDQAAIRERLAAV